LELVLSHFSHQFTDPFVFNSVMILTYHKLNPAEKLFPMPHLNWVFLTREERKRVITMIHESNGNDLLVEMLRWFSAKFMEEDKDVEKATQTLRKHVTNAVRQPKSYQVE
jgi:urease accessory protein UreE